ncbi:transcription factor TFIIE beta subunit [Glugoides intestinalis]
MNNADNNKHINTFVHKILEMLKKYDRAMSYTEVQEKTGINVMSNVQLLKQLKKNPKIVINHESIQFLPSYIVRSADDLFHILQEVNGKEGIEMNKLLDSPIDVKPFIEELASQKKLIVLKDIDNSEIVFFNEAFFPVVKQEIKDLWASIPVPNLHDIANELSEVGLKSSAVQVLKKQKIPKQQSRKKSKRRIVLTNTHVKGLNLENLDDSD